MPRPSNIAWLASGLLPFFAGCTIVAGYSETSETSAQACSDARDNDLDGRVDCADPDCFGSAECDEDSSRSLALCSDGLDNDLDGLIDDFDPACWSVAPLDALRCSTIRGTAGTLELASFIGGDYRRDEGALLLGPSEGQEARYAVLLGGKLSQTELRVRGMLSEGSALTVQLEPRASESFASASIVASVDRASNEASVGAGPNSTTLSIPGTDDSFDWFLRVGEDGVIRLRLTDGAECPSSECVEFRNQFENLGRAPTFSLSFRVRGAAELHAVSAARDSHHPCFTPVPFEGDGPEGVIHTVAASNEQFCALFEETDGSMAILVAGRDSMPPAMTEQRPNAPDFERASGLWLEGEDLRDPVITWDRRSDRFVGAAVRVEAGTVTNRVALIASRDCERWEILGDAVSDGSSNAMEFRGRRGGILGYWIEADGQHTLVTVGTDDVGQSSDGPRQRWVSATGVEGSFEKMDEEVSTNDSLPTRHPQVHVTKLLGHELALGQSLQTMGTIGQERVGETEPFPLLVPSGRGDTFDGAWIEQGLLWMPEPVEGYAWNGMFFYTARECGDCPNRFGFAHFRPAGVQTYARP